MKKTQLELGIQREKELDRNFSQGGRSFYFFDFDDNIACLTTPLILFHKETNVELPLSSHEWANVHHLIGKSGIYKDYEIRYCDKTGTFKFFRDHEAHELEKLGHKEQVFVKDIAEILGFQDVEWKGPSWECFYHACFNQRPISIITARGHKPETIRQGIRKFVEAGWLPHEPNYLTIFPVSHIPTRKDLGDIDLSLSTAELKQRAIRRSVEKAFELYGFSIHHRFGMSDDDPKNLDLIVSEMKRLKEIYPEICFFVIETHKGAFVKHEIRSQSHLVLKNTAHHEGSHRQLTFFNES
ncbi:MAG: hypothetical protein L6Q37_07805 [Bdellovibrionaceae bacterium]|nr:hypothetical protein [Pseudobdellovibrionaceae bacterium]NUM58921.1 hypothetical protein [Pseudobdellovibrionaceae bacterium]